MTKPQLHPWLSTPEALRAARAATRVPAAKLPASCAAAGGPDELFSEALAILTECALPPRERGHLACAECGKPLHQVRAGAKFCTPKCSSRNRVRRFREDVTPPPVPASAKSHVGSMWSWPEGEMTAYAARQVGMVLCNYLRTRAGQRETPASHRLESVHLVTPEDEPGAREILEDYVSAHGVRADGTETLDELAAAVQWLRTAAPVPAKAA